MARCVSSSIRKRRGNVCAKTRALPRAVLSSGLLDPANCRLAACGLRRTEGLAAPPQRERGGLDVHFGRIRRGNSRAPARDQTAGIVGTNHSPLACGYYRSPIVAVWSIAFVIFVSQIPGIIRLILLQFGFCLHIFKLIEFNGPSRLRPFK